MTGPYDDDSTGIFDHLDDPAAPAPSRELLATVVHRGRRIRTRRQGTFALTGAAAVTAAVVAGLGISHAVDASRGHDSLITPAVTPTPAPSLSAAPGHHRQPGAAVIVPGGVASHPVASPTIPPSPSPCDVVAPSASPAPLDNGPIVEPSVPPVLSTTSPEPCPSDTASPTPTPTDTSSPTSAPSDTGTPSPSPS